MVLSVQKATHLTGEVTPPSSKSQSIRGMMFALLARGESTLINPLHSDDMQDAMTICTQLGVRLSLLDDRLIIKSEGLPLKMDTQMLYSGNSGITTRFVMPLIGLRALNQRPMVLDCGEQMRARPIQSLVNALRQLGLTIDYVDKINTLPISISGQLQGGVVEVDGLTSQYLSSLLIALPCAPLDSEVTVKHLHERPYMEMTLNWLKMQHIHIHHNRMKDKDVYHIQGRQTYHPFQTMIAGDFSSASYLIAAAVLFAGRVKLCGLDMNDPQGDKRLVAILQAMGADIVVTAQAIVIQGGRPLKGIPIDANDIPDLLPTLAVVGTYATGKTDILNVPQARIKETDRIHSMVEGLTRLGAKIEEYPDGMVVYQSELHGARLKGYDDHRTVMALAVAGLLAEGTTYIDDSDAINKTFPTFVSLMTSLGAKMEVIHEPPV